MAYSIDDRVFNYFSRFVLSQLVMTAERNEIGVVSPKPQQLRCGYKAVYNHL